MIYHASPDLFYVYLIVSADGKYYTGLTDDLVKKFAEHLNGVNEMKDARLRTPLKLTYYETISDFKTAVERQVEVENLTIAAKETLIATSIASLPLVDECNNMDPAKAPAVSGALAPAVTQKRIGILGGGQLGRMLLQAAANYPVETFVSGIL